MCYSKGQFNDISLTSVCNKKETNNISMENRKEIDIKILDDDCLAEVFTHLPLKKRIEIEEGIYD